MKKIGKMNIRIGLMICLISVFAIAVSAQYEIDNDEYTDSDRLIIQRENGQKITLVWLPTRKLHESFSWMELIKNFQTDYKKVYDDIPEFDFYSIHYVQNKKLVVDEVQGRETYTLNDKNEVKYTKSNQCKLVDNNGMVIIEFDGKDELLDPTLIKDIQEAAAKIKYKFYFSRISRESHFYSVDQGDFVKQPKPKALFTPTFGIRLGVVKDQLYMEYNLGAGAIIDRNKLFSLNASMVTGYSERYNLTQADFYLGANFSTMSKGTDIGFELAYKLNDGIKDYEDMNFRVRLTLRTKNLVQIGVETYYRSIDNSLFGFSLGLGI